MTRNIPAVILGSMAGIVVSMSSGFLLASYVVAGIAPAYAAPPRLATADREAPAFIDDNWPTPNYAVRPAESDQASGVRFSGSSRL